MLTDGCSELTIIIAPAARQHALRTKMGREGEGEANENCRQMVGNLIISSSAMIETKMCHVMQLH
jgi:hypothetical protein